jgi:hypothetical protein
MADQGAVVTDHGVLKVEQRWRYVCRSCDATWLGLPPNVVAEGSGEPTPPEQLAAELGVHVGAAFARLTVLRPHDIVLETYWRVTT